MNISETAKLNNEDAALPTQWPKCGIMERKVDCEMTNITVSLLPKVSYNSAVPAGNAMIAQPLVLLPTSFSRTLEVKSSRQLIRRNHH